jgi:D-xylose transport system ATP-binding protein
MVGRELTNVYPRKPHTPGKVLLEVKDWTVYDPGINKTIDHVSFTLRQGEILGLAGLVGAGRTELVMSLFHVWGRLVAGKIYLEGKELAKDAGDAVGLDQPGVGGQETLRPILRKMLQEHISASLKKIAVNSVVNE